MIIEEGYGSALSGWGWGSPCPNTPTHLSPLWLGPTRSWLPGNDWHHLALLAHLIQRHICSVHLAPPCPLECLRSCISAQKARYHLLAPLQGSACLAHPPGHSRYPACSYTMDPDSHFCPAPNTHGLALRQALPTFCPT